MQVLDSEIVNQQKEKLLAKMRTLDERCGGVKGPHSTIIMAKIISSCVCERQIRHLLEYGDIAKENQRFDSYYRQKSEFATIKILECLKARFNSDGVNAGILTEAQNELGRYDVVVIQGYPYEVYAKNEEVVRIEVKASLGLNLEQIDRYLWNPSPLILVRVITGHVAKLQPQALQPYIFFSLRELNAKIDRLLSGKFYTIPGSACVTCLDSSCTYNRSKSRKPMSMVTMSDTEFTEDLTSFFQNLSYVAERTASLVIEELKKIQFRVKETQKTGEEIIGTLQKPL
jgi:hypothetical protein